jgi:tol-pal system protein YbgF
MKAMRALAVLAVGALGGCVAVPPEEDPVQIRLNDIDARVQRIERVVSNQSLLDLAQRLAVQAELRTLRGRLEELENSTQALRKQQRDLYADLDERLNAAAQSAPAAGTAGAGASGAEQAAYTQAFEALKAGSYPTAITGFRQFLATYPKSTLIDNAQYWLGESYYVTRDYPNALAAFQEVLARSPDSRKAPDALLKLGLTQYELKRPNDARATLTEVTKRYPDTEAAKVATERLRRMKAGSR